MGGRGLEPPWATNPGLKIVGKIIQAVITPCLSSDDCILARECCDSPWYCGSLSCMGVCVEGYWGALCGFTI